MKIQPPERRRSTIKATRYIKAKFDDRDAQGHGSYGTRTVAEEDHEVEVEITVNWDAIARELGRDAFYNKSGAARDGNVSVRVVKSTKIAERQLVGDKTTIGKTP